MSSKQDKIRIPKRPIPLEKAQHLSSNGGGLNDEQVAIRLGEGLINVDRSKRGKTVFQIILSNLFTYFNLIYFIVTVVLLVNREYEQLVFLVVVVANTLISLIQEIRSKKSLDKLKLLTIPTVRVMRNGIESDLPSEEVVLGDLIHFTSGNQICADSEVVSGTVEVNEAMLTGESDNVTKRAGDKLFSGSYVISNHCYARVISVGKYNYVNRLSQRASRYRKPRSQLNGSFKIILYAISALIPVLTCFNFLANLIASGATMQDIRSFSGISDFIATLSANNYSLLVQKTASPVVNLIPAGPFLLTSMALAVSVIRLAKSKIMVQELYCIEMLARVDCLCLDKTGTLTDGTMRVVESTDLRADGKMMVKDVVSTMVAVLGDNNMTSRCLRDFYGDKKHVMLKPTKILPFSSERKFSAVSFEGQGTYFLGAPEFILNGKNARVDDMVAKYASQGYRVLLLAYSTGQIMNNGELQLPVVRRPVAVIVIEDHLRPDAADTLKWFAELGVGIKLISGDNPVTVSNIASRLNVPNAELCISLEGLSDEQVKQAALNYTIFGRVTPDQKALLVQALRASGRTVAMTGDGVNDILALREADCSIALAGGSDAARNTSHLVLLDDNFSSLPKVVAEGRRVVNNIQNASSMFFMKTVFLIFVLIFASLITLVYGMPYLYPFSSTQLMLIDTFVVGIPTMLLALQPNKNLIKGHFLVNTFRRALPAALTFLISFLVVFAFWKWGNLPSQLEAHHTVAAICYGFCGFYALIMACKPFNTLKLVMVCGVFLAMVSACVFFSEFLGYAALVPLRESLLLLFAVTFGSFPVYSFLYGLFNGFNTKSLKGQ